MMKEVGSPPPQYRIDTGGVGSGAATVSASAVTGAGGGDAARFLGIVVVVQDEG